jgi:endonuclease IV
MAILGAHMSIAGGYHRAVERAAACGCDCVQLFTKSNSQWRAKPMFLETPKGKENGVDLDVINLRVLRGLIHPPGGRSHDALSAPGAAR